MDTTVWKYCYVPHIEHHRLNRSGGLRAAVLGATDGIVSTASLIMGITAAGSGQDVIAVAGIAGLVAGAISMAAGEYVSVQSQADTEKADLAMESEALEDSPEEELIELQGIYVGRGLSPELALEVAKQLTAHDALAAHARDEIGITDQLSAQPYQAAFVSALAFSLGGSAPVALTLLMSPAQIVWMVPLLTVILLAALGAVAAGTGGASKLRGAMRVCFWGTIAMAVTSGVGHLFGIAV